MDSDNFCCGLTRRTSDAPHTTCEWNSKAKNIKSLASFVSIINLPCAPRTFASKSKIYRLTSSCELFTWHCCVLTCWHSKGPQPTIYRERREKKRWIFTSTDDSLLAGKAAHFRPAEENQECPHCRTTASVQFNHRRKYNEHRPTFCRFSNLFLARSAHSPRFGEFYLLFASSSRIFAYDPRERETSTTHA